MQQGRKRNNGREAQGKRGQQEGRSKKTPPLLCLRHLLLVFKAPSVGVLSPKGRGWPKECPSLEGGWGRVMCVALPVALVKTRIPKIEEGEL